MYNRKLRETDKEEITTETKLWTFLIDLMNLIAIGMESVALSSSASL